MYADGSRLSRTRYLAAVLALIVAIVVFGLLAIASDGVMFSLLAAVGAIALFVLAHYLFWGRTMLHEVADARRAEDRQRRQEWADAVPADRFPLMIDEGECSALRHAVASALAAQPHEFSPEERQRLDQVLSKARGLDA